MLSFDSIESLRGASRRSAEAAIDMRSSAPSYPTRRQRLEQSMRDIALAFLGQSELPKSRSQDDAEAIARDLYAVSDDLEKAMFDFDSEAQ